MLDGRAAVRTGDVERKAPKEARQKRRLPGLEWVAAGSVTILLLYEGILAVRLRVEYFDAYENLLNASRIVHAGTFYSPARSPFYPLMLTPLAFMGRLARSPEVEFVGAHLLAVLLFGLLLLLAFMVFRLFLGRLAALAGVMLLSWNMLLINNAPLAKEDIPGAFFTTAAFYCYLRGRLRGRPRWLVLAGALIAAAMGTRYNLLPLPFLVIGAYEVAELMVTIATGRWNPSQFRQLLVKLGALFVLPVILYLLLLFIVYPAAQQASISGTPAQFVEDVLLLLKQNAFHEDTIRNYRFLLESVTWPLLLVGVAGALACLLTRQRGSLFFALWLAVFFLFQTYVITHQEARYLVPMLTAVYFFVARGLEEVWIQASRLLPVGRKPRLAAALLLGSLSVLPLFGALNALARQQDPVYTRDYEATVSRYAASLLQGGHIYWIGPYYTLHPRDYVFDRDDPFTYVYHDYYHVVTFWTGVRAFPVADIQPAPDGSISLAGDNLVGRFRDGDALIVNPASKFYETHDIPPSLPPLIVEEIRIRTFTPASTQSGGSELLVAAGGAQIRAAPEAEGGSLDGIGLADGPYELYAAVGSAPLDSLGQVTVSNGAFHLRLERAQQSVEQIVLLSYASVKAFPFSAG